MYILCSKKKERGVMVSRQKKKLLFSLAGQKTIQELTVGSQHTAVETFTYVYGSASIGYVLQGKKHHERVRRRSSDRRRGGIAFFLSERLLDSSMTENDAEPTVTTKKPSIGRSFKEEENVGYVRTRRRAKKQKQKRRKNKKKPTSGLRICFLLVCEFILL